MSLTGASLEKARRRWFARTLEAVLGVAIPVYLIALFVDRELGVAKALKLPLIFASLILAIELLQRQDAAVAALDRRVASMESNLAALTVAAMRQHDGTEVKFYRNRQLYEATRHAVERAKSRVFVTYLRSSGPSRSDGAHAYMEACRDWALRHADHRFRRVIRHGPDAGLADFIADELAAEFSASAQDRHYHVRLVPYEEFQAETVRIGLYDYDTVFLTYSSDVDSIIGFSIKSREIVQQYFEPYFDKIWESARPIDRFPS